MKVRVLPGELDGVWAKGEPPALGAGQRVSSILTTPTVGLVTEQSKGQGRAGVYALLISK